MADDDDLNKLLLQQQRELDTSKRHDVIVQVQKYLANNPYHAATPCAAASSSYGKRIGEVANFGGPIGGHDLGHQIVNWWINEDRAQPRPPIYQAESLADIVTEQLARTFFSEQ